MVRTGKKEEDNSPPFNITFNLSLLLMPDKSLVVVLGATHGLRDSLLRGKHAAATEFAASVFPETRACSLSVLATSEVLLRRSGGGSARAQFLRVARLGQEHEDAAISSGRKPLKSALEDVACGLPPALRVSRGLLELRACSAAQRSCAHARASLVALLEWPGVAPDASAALEIATACLKHTDPTFLHYKADPTILALAAVARLVGGRVEGWGGVGSVGGPVLAARTLADPVASAALDTCVVSDSLESVGAAAAIPLEASSSSDALCGCDASDALDDLQQRMPSAAEAAANAAAVPSPGAASMPPHPQKKRRLGGYPLEAEEGDPFDVEELSESFEAEAFEGRAESGEFVAEEGISGQNRKCSASSKSAAAAPVVGTDNNVDVGSCERALSDAKHYLDDAVLICMSVLKRAYARALATKKASEASTARARADAANALLASTADSLAWIVMLHYAVCVCMRKRQEGATAVRSFLWAASGTQSSTKKPLDSKDLADMSVQKLCGGSSSSEDRNSSSLANDSDMGSSNSDTKTSESSSSDTGDSPGGNSDSS